MKTPILIIILCLCFVRGFCQVSLDSIYVQGATWCGAHYTDYVTNHLGTFGALHSRWTIHMGGDTTVNSTVYKKLYSSLMLDPTKAFAGVRYEKDSNKVYLIMLDSMPGVGWSGYAVHAIYMDTIPLNTEVILYDFNMDKGDTVKWKVGKQKVLLVDTSRR